MVRQLQKRGTPRCLVSEGRSGVHERQPWQHVCESLCEHDLLTTAVDNQDSTPLDNPDDSSVTYIECVTPSKHPGHQVSAPKSAVASLRQNLSRRSRQARHGSMSSVFRRSGSNASSLHGAHDPESITSYSQETRNIASPLAKDGYKNKDPATLVPLPSSPIDIPPPLPVLRVDLGPPVMLSPFAMTNADLAEIKVLQDPTNITTGIPPSFPLNWQDRKFPFHLRRGASSELQEIGGQRISIEHYPAELSPVSVDGSFQHHILHSAHDNPPRIGESYGALRNDNTRQGLAPQQVDCDDPFRVPLSSPKLSHNSATLIKATDDNMDQQLDCMKPMTCHCQAPSPVASAVEPQTRNDDISIHEDLIDEPTDAFQLPSPVVALRLPSAQRTSEVADQTNCTASAEKLSGNHEPTAAAEVSLAHQKYRDSLAGAAEGLKREKLKPAVTRCVEQNPFVGPTGTLAPNPTRGDSVPPTTRSLPPNGNLCTTEISIRNLHTAELVQESKENGEDSMFEDTKRPIVHSQGPPSPERLVRLPLRPKPPITKHTSFESTLFKPILDRVAAKHLGVFRPGSDPSLRQKYFPHSAVDTNVSFQYPRQPSLDLDDTVSDAAESCDDIGIFERTVEQPSPLHIRKQSGATSMQAVSSPQTPVGTSTSQAPGSSPIRTPSMGDRQQFELQRAERHARYSAIYSGGPSNTALEDDSDIQLAEFGNAGPGSRGSTPSRNSGGRGRENRETPNGLERVMHHTPSPRFACATGNRAFLALSKD
jgi:hypothetical protein